MTKTSPGLIPGGGIQSMESLPRTFYDRETVVVARELLGKVLVHDSEEGTRAGRIVEVEAYIGAHDRASHSSRGITPRTRIMFGPAGFAYVYRIYGIYHCVNVVTEPAGNGCAVLIRAVEPMTGIVSKTSGPGLVCSAMGIDLKLNGSDLLAGPLRVVESADGKEERIVSRARIGVDYAGAWARRLLRFYVAGSAHDSRP